MMTLSMTALGYPRDESAALLSPCHNQISLPVAAFYGSAGCGRVLPAGSFSTLHGVVFAILRPGLPGCGQRSFVLDLFS
jgi:hypothetical protein